MFKGFSVQNGTELRFGIRASAQGSFHVALADVKTIQGFRRLGFVHTSSYTITKAII